MCESVSDSSYSAYSPRERAIQDRESEDERIRFMKEEDRRWGHDNSDYYNRIYAKREPIDLYSDSNAMLTYADRFNLFNAIVHFAEVPGVDIDELKSIVDKSMPNVNELRGARELFEKVYKENQVQDNDANFVEEAPAVPSVEKIKTNDEKELVGD